MCGWVDEWVYGGVGVWVWVSRSKVITTLPVEGVPNGYNNNYKSCLVKCQCNVCQRQQVNTIAIIHGNRSEIQYTNIITINYFMHAKEIYHILYYTSTGRGLIIIISVCVNRRMFEKRSECV